MAAPSVADQALSFGALTKAGAGGVIPANTGGAITSASIDSGDASGHWQIASDGTIAPSSTGDSAELGSGPYALDCTFTNGEGSDGATVTITIVANRYHVVSGAELVAAVADAESVDNTDQYTVHLRDDADVENGGSDINLFSYTFSGDIADDNEGASESAYDYDAVASWDSGGYVKIAADTPLSPQISDRVRILGCTGIEFSGIRFTNVPASDSYNRAVGNADTSAATAAHQLHISLNGTHTAEPIVWVHDCEFGGNAVNGNSNRWGQCVIVDIAQHCVVEDCSFDGFYIGMTFSSVIRGVARRNAMQNQLVDAIRCFDNRTADLGSYTLTRFECTSNVIWNPSEDEDWAGAHADGIQLGTSADEVDYSIFIASNYVYNPVPPVTYPGETTERNTQGIYLDDTVGVDIDGIIRNNLVVCTASAGIALWVGTVTCKNNTLVKDTLHQEPSANSGGILIRVRDGTGHVIDDNITKLVNDEGGTFSESGTVNIDEDASQGDGDSAYDLFNGPIGVGTHGPEWTAVTDSGAAALTASLDSIFASKYGSAALGAGYLQGRLSVTEPFSANAANPLYFDLSKDAGNIPANTEAITIRFTGLKQTNPATAQKLVAATSTTFDVEVKNSDGSLFATVEDSGGAKELSVQDLGVDLTANTPQEVVLCASLPDDKFWVTIDGTPAEIAMTDQANELFSTSRYFVFCANSVGDNQLEYTLESIELWYSASADPSDGSVPATAADWSVTGPLATAVADPNAVGAGLVLSLPRIARAVNRDVNRAAIRDITDVAA